MTKSKNSRVVNWKSRRETDDSDSSSDEKHGMRLLGGGSLKACSDLHLQRRSCRCSGASRKLPECSCSGLAASGVLWSALERVPFHLRRQNVVTASIGRTLDWEAIPVWMRENEYITTGYRKEQNSWRGCIKSIFGYVHNETVNIWTHLGGAVFFAILLVLTLGKVMSHHTTVTWHDAAGFAVFLVATVICLSLSAAYHTSRCHSPTVAKSCAMLDYSGIVALTVGSFFPTIYYGFYCFPSLQRFYLGGITTSGLGAAFVVLRPECTRYVRSALFFGLAFTGIVPVCHALYIHGIEALHLEMGLGWLLLSAGLYAVGAILYCARFPERFFPGKVDLVGASHQLWHVASFFAALCHYVSIYEAFQHTHGTKGAVCPVPVF